MLCVGFITLSSKFYVWMAYIHGYGIAIVAMIHHILYLHKTHVIYNKKQEQYGIKSKEEETKLWYAMLYYMHLKLKKLMLVLTSNVSGYTILLSYMRHMWYML